MNTLIKAFIFVAVAAMAYQLVKESGFRFPHDQYAVAEIRYPNSKIIGVSIRKVPDSICEETLEEIDDLLLESCKDCTLSDKTCYDELPGPYIGIFDNLWIGFPYVAFNAKDKYPERFIMVNMPYHMFSEFCAFIKERYPNAVCRNH